MFSNLIGQLIVSTENDQWSMLNLQDLWSPKIVRLRTLFGQTDREGLSPTCDSALKQKSRRARPGVVPKSDRLTKTDFLYLPKID